MGTRSWQSSANRYYAFDGEELDSLPRVPKTPPPLSTRSSRSPLPATCTQKSAPTTTPMYESPTSPKSSLLDRISPKRFSPHSKPAKESPPLSPVLGDYLDSHSGEEEEEEEQVMRVLHNNHELVFRRDSGIDEPRDQDEDPHEPRNSSPVKRRKLIHPNQPASSSTPKSSPSQNESNLMTQPTPSGSRSPPIPQSITSPPPQKQLLTSHTGVDWRSGSSMKGGSHFGKLSGLTFGFAESDFDANTKVNTTGKPTCRGTNEVVPVPKPSRDDLLADKDNSRRLEGQIDTHEPIPPSGMIIEDQRETTHDPSKEEGKESNGGASLLRPTRSHGPISDPQLEVPLEGGEDHDPGHEANHEGADITECDASPSPIIPPSLSGDVPMDSPPPPKKSPRTLKHEELPKDVAHSASVTSSTKLTLSPHPEGADTGSKSMEQYAEDLLRDIHKEYLSRTEARAAFPPTELERVIPRLPGGAYMSLDDHNEHPRISSAPILGGISHPVGAGSISPIIGIDLRCLTSDAMSTSAQTPGSTLENPHSSIAQSTNDPNSNDTLLELDPELDQITKQALGDLIVHNLKLSHNLDVHDDVRSAIKLEVDEHARDFLKLATKLARRMDLMGELLESTVKPNQMLVEPILSNTTENGYLECLPPINGSEGNEEPQPPREDIQCVASDVEMDSVPPGVSQSDSEDKVNTEPNDEPAGEQEPDVDNLVERVDRVESVDDEDDSYESGLDIPGVWCARTGKDRTDTIQEHVGVSKVLAARVKKWVKKSGGSKE